MKSVLLILTILSMPVFAEESTADKINSSADRGQDAVVETAKKASSGTKKVLRKIGRKSMDATCELSNTKEHCVAEKAKHEAETKKDEVEGVSPY